MKEMEKKMLETRIEFLEDLCYHFRNQQDKIAERLHNARRVAAAAQDRIAALQAENRYRYTCTVRLRKRKTAEIARLTAEIARRNARIIAGWNVQDKLAQRLHDCRADRRNWRDLAERCFASAMKNAVLLADERNEKRGE